ncbi:uncharacterized protein RJT20DRAFT_42171 [Scheffersomyces xylosifermentans]|uniref:uncharacterized protein n=1 Tax=Scheffersomyces xylosifermentans TaxID=1304137 RepID=UPI00315C594A
MWKYLFGTSDDTAPLTNEPTIDYNQTIDYYNANNHLNTTSNFKTTGGNATEEISGDVIDYSDDELDSDEELNRDFQRISENYTKTSHSLAVSNYSLPSAYPGKFPRSTSATTIQNEYANTQTARGLQSTTNHANILTNKIVPDPTTQPQRYTGRKSKITPDEKNEDRITDEIANLQQEISNELRVFRAKNNGQGFSLESAIDQVKNQNRFLQNMNELVDISINENEKENIPGNILKKYLDLKEAYIKEMTNSQMFYKGYYKLIVKYRALKKSSNLATGKSSKTSKSGLSIKEKVRVVKSSTKDPNIKTICANILQELDSIADKDDQLILKYKHDLEAANNRIRLLEEQLKEK